MRRLLVIGPIPPPYHGVTISTSLVLGNQELRRVFAVEHIDTSDRRSLENIEQWDPQNIWLAMKSLVDLLVRLRGGPGVVYLPLSQSLPGFLRDSLLIELAAFRKWSVTIHLRGGEFRTFYDSAPRAVRWWIRHALKRTASVGVMGANLRWIFEGIVPAERIAVVTNGTPDLALDCAAREVETGLYLGSLRRRKGVVEALEAALLILGERPDARFIFVGEWESPELEATMRARAREANGRIEFWPVATGDAKRAVLERAGYLLFCPVEPEGHPRVVLEAHAAGLPTIATNRGAIVETVVEGQTGFVVEEPVPEELADRVLRLLRDPELRNRMGRAAREHYLTHLTQENADRRLAEWLGAVA